MAFPILSAASFQSVLIFPSPQVAESCGSFFRSTAKTFQAPMYLRALHIPSERRSLGPGLPTVIQDFNLLHALANWYMLLHIQHSTIHMSPGPVLQAELSYICVSRP